MMLGYIADRKLREFFASDTRISLIRKDDDHDRKKKGDLVVTYEREEFKIEVKSLQTNSIEVFDDRGREDITAERWIKRVIKLEKRYLENPDFAGFLKDRRSEGRYRGVVQCDASDRRSVKLRGGKKIDTTCLLVGEFDLLAAGLFAFREQWDFGFALNRDLPTSNYRKYSKAVQKQLLRSLVPVTWPLAPPFVADPFKLLETLYQERRRSKS